MQEYLVEDQDSATTESTDTSEDTATTEESPAAQENAITCE